MEQEIDKYKLALKKAATKIEELSTIIHDQKSNEEVAVIGYSCRFPGDAWNIEGFWHVLVNGKDSVTEIKSDRFDYNDYYSDNPDAEGKMVTKNASFLRNDIKDFDNLHFGLSAIEAASIDPQQRLLLEVSWEAMENSALNVEKLKGSRTGVFIGMSAYEYATAELFSGDACDITPYSTVGVSIGSAAGRLSYFYDFKGPAVTCDTACSSSISALNMAVDSLRNNQCDMAIVGGSNLLLTPEPFIGLSKFNGLSKDGQCRAFDNDADGFGRGEGCGVIILKRLKDAKSDRNKVAALVKSVAIGQDGKSNGFTAPNGLSQQSVIRQALHNAKLTIDDIDYIETHGTGTPLGDLIEVQSLAEVFKNKKDTLLIGSVKPNIGHLEAASGMASLIKVISSIENKKILPNIYSKNPNKNILWEKVKIADEFKDWHKPDGVRRAGISSFGFSGTLAHVILEEAPQDKEEQLDELPTHLLTLSAKNEKALREYVGSIKEQLLEAKSSIADIAYTSNISRSFLNYRFSAVGKSKEDLLDTVEQVLNQTNLEFLIQKSTSKDKKIAFLFTGQGSIYEGIAKDLYTTSSIFRETMNLCNEKFNAILGLSILDGIYGEDKTLLSRPLYSQATIFSIEYALTKLWSMLGIKPSIIIGHSIGEYAAACYAGLIGLDDVILMIAQRGRMMESIDVEGKMVVILTNVEYVKAALEESGCKHVSLAAINAPDNITISGRSDEVDIVIETLQAKQRVFFNKLNIPHPYHSSLMKDYEGMYEKGIGDITFSKLQVAMISSITGKLENEEVLGNSKYWVEHLSNTVDFQSAIQEAKRLGVDIFIEIGGDATLSGLANQCIDDDDILFLPSMRREADNYTQFFNSVSALYMKGMDLDWHSFYKSYTKRKVNLPNYPFQKKELWREVKRMDRIAGVEEKAAGSVTERKEVAQHSQQPQSQPQQSQNRNNSSRSNPKEKIKSELKEMIKILTGLKIEEIEDDLNLLTLGFDSLVLIQLNKQITNKFNLSITLNEFFINLDTVEKITEHINKHTDWSVDEEDSETVSEPVSSEIVNMTPYAEQPNSYVAVGKEQSSSLVAIDGMGAMQHIFAAQMKIMEEQLGILKNITNPSSVQTVAIDNKLSSAKSRQVSVSSSKAAPLTVDTKSHYVPYKKLDLIDNENFDDLQLTYIRNIERKYTSYSKKSKENIQRYRKVYANNRNVAGFRPVMKEMIYQIVADTGQGSKLRDIDGNNIVDLTMGFGVNLLGHSPSFINKALTEELDRGMPLGPMGRLAGTVAEQISHLTGVERVAFYNSGTEANMVAVRIARASTGKKKIVTFAGSYHGTYDGLLGLSSIGDDGSLTTIPLAPGIMDSVVSDLVMLNYNQEASLEFIKNNAHDIAGVLVETVQSRRPDVQPKEFLKKLRQITEENGIALIFDEIITGFRIGPGGAQEYFGIKADIATYGKVLGGGMPIGVVSGKSEFMDCIDGGMWSFGDTSVPPCENKRTFVAGTFSHHPLAMAAAHASLTYITENKDTLYAKLNKKTTDFANRVNAYFEANHVPIKVVHFGSLFRFVFRGDFEIFFFGLLEKGVYVWEGRNCFFSTEHSDEDIEYIFNAIKKTIEEMGQTGYLGGESPLSQRTDLLTNSGQIEVKQPILPMSLIQQRLYTLSSISKDDPYNMVTVLKVKGGLDQPKFESVLNEIVKRHESLRTRLFVEDGEFKQEVLEHVEFKIDIVKKDHQEDLDELIEKLVTPFDLAKAPLFKVILIKEEDDEGTFIFNFHHTIADGISMSIFVQEFMQLYGNEHLLPVNKQYRDFVEWETQYLNSNEKQQSEQYWLSKLSGDLNVLKLPTDFPAHAESDFAASTVHMKIDSALVHDLKLVSKRNKCSLFMLLAAGFNLLLKQLTSNEDICIGTPVTNRADGSFNESIGMFTNTIVLKNNLANEKTFTAFLNEVKQNCLEAYSHMYYPYNFLASLMKKAKNSREGFLNVRFVYEKIDERVLTIDNLEISPYEYRSKLSDFDFVIEILEENGLFQIGMTYKSSLFKEETIERWGQTYKDILAFITHNDDDDGSKLKLKDFSGIGRDKTDKLAVDGNLDRDALPVFTGRAVAGVSYEAPRNEIEEVLAKVWEVTLGSNPIGINDDFFQMGGDSIKAIQLISRARAKGYNFEVDHLYKCPTIKQLVQFVEQQHSNNSQEPLAGTVKLTPIQRAYFEQESKDEHQWTQAKMLYKAAGFKVDIIRKVFNKLLVHHDALRMVFKNENGNVVQINRGIEQNLYDLNVYENVSEQDVIEACNEIQSRMDIEKGPLVRLGLFKMNAGDKLFIVIHGLVIDEESWTILLDDFSNAYTQAEQGLKIVFAEKTISFKEWSEKLNGYADSYPVKRQAEYWKRVHAADIKKLPRERGKLAWS